MAVWVGEWVDYQYPQRVIIRSHLGSSVELDDSFKLLETLPRMYCSDFMSILLIMRSQRQQWTLANVHRSESAAFFSLFLLANQNARAARQSRNDPEVSENTSEHPSLPALVSSSSSAPDPDESASDWDDSASDWEVFLMSRV